MTFFLEWYRTNWTQITWWVIGWLTFAVVDCLVKGDYVLAVVDALLVVFNYKMWKNRAE